MEGHRFVCQGGILEVGYRYGEEGGSSFPEEVSLRYSMSDSEGEHVLLLRYYRISSFSEVEDMFPFDKPRSYEGH